MSIATTPQKSDEKSEFRLCFSFKLFFCRKHFNYPFPSITITCDSQKPSAATSKEVKKEEKEIQDSKTVQPVNCYPFPRTECSGLATITSKINVTPKGVYLPISKLHSILAVANLLAHNNKTQICHCGQISLQSVAVFLTIWHLWG